MAGLVASLADANSQFTCDFDQRLHPLAAKALRMVCARAFARPNVDMLSRIMGCSRRELERRFRNAHLPPPHRLVVLGRWMVISWTALDCAIPPRLLAIGAGFPSTQSFCRAARREIGRGAPSLRQRETHDHIVHDILSAFAPSAD